MKIWYVAEGFRSEEESKAPWEFGIEWDQVNLMVNFTDEMPKPNEEVLMVGYSFDGAIKAPARLKQWPIEKVGDSFYYRIVDAIFESAYDLDKMFAKRSER